MEMWSMPTTREGARDLGWDLGRDLARAMGCSSGDGRRKDRGDSCGHNGRDIGLFPGDPRMGKAHPGWQAGDETMGSMSKTLGALALASGALFAGDALAGTLDQLRDSKTMRIAYDPDAPPYSYIVPGSPSNADPQGYSVDLCRAVFDTLREQLKIPDMKIVYVAVNSQDRFAAITGNKADLLCT